MDCFNNICSVYWIFGTYWNLMMKVNYQQKMESQILALKEKKRLLLHACCAPCSSAVLEKLCDYFDITIYYYNPNISPETEFNKRYDELEKLIEKMKLNVKTVKAPYENNLFEKTIESFREMPEGGIRCFRCYELRMNQTACFAKENGYDYFTTTLSISPYKNADKLNEIGQKLANQYGISYLFADFKKKDGYKRSIELSSIYHLYRQNYCGCIYSRKKEG